MSTQLVAYFSATGTTARIAGKLAQALGADLHEIEPAQPYSAADLDWRDASSRSSVEMADRFSRPAIAGEPISVAGYERIWLGFPIWWYREPSLIDTFLEAHDFAGKTIVLFATSGSSGFGQTAAEVAGHVDASATIEEGTVLTAGSTEAELEAWLASLQ